MYTLAPFVVSCLTLALLPTCHTSSLQIEVKRLVYEHAGRKIYEWDQSLQDINMYVETPPGVRAKHLDVKITPSQLTIGLKGNPPFISVREDVARHHTLRRPHPWKCFSATA